MEAREKIALEENRRIRKFIDKHELDFVAELYDEDNGFSYSHTFLKYDYSYRLFAMKHNSDKRNFNKLDPDSFSKHFSPIEHCV